MSALHLAGDSHLWRGELEEQAAPLPDPVKPALSETTGALGFVCLAELEEDKTLQLPRRERERERLSISSLKS